MALDRPPGILYRSAHGLAILFLVASMLVGPAPLVALATPSGSLKLSPGKQAAVRIGAKRTTSIAQAAVTTPARPSVGDRSAVVIAQQDRPPDR